MKIHERARSIIDEQIINTTAMLQCTDIHKNVKKQTGLRVSLSLLRQYIKQHLNLRYKSLKPITFNHNKDENKLQRQYAAAKYIQILEYGVKIINIDETVIRSTDHRKRSWNSIGKNNIVSHSQRLNSINMIAAVSSHGEVFFTINHGKTNSYTFPYFLSKLIKNLDCKDKNWRQNTVFIIDNAPYHRSKQIMEVYRQLGLPLMFLGPYQYKLAPIELFFAFIKNRDLNPLNIRAHSRGYLHVYIKELCLHVSSLDFKWVSNSFKYILTYALESLSMQDL